MQRLFEEVGPECVCTLLQRCPSLVGSSSYSRWRPPSADQRTHQNHPPEAPLRELSLCGSPIRRGFGLAAQMETSQHHA